MCIYGTRGNSGRKPSQKKHKSETRGVNEEVIGVGHKNGDILNASSFKDPQDSLDTSEFPIPESDPMHDNSRNIAIRIGDVTDFDPVDVAIENDVDCFDRTEISSMDNNTTIDLNDVSESDYIEIA
ncbi:5957_t:CDS:2, partial [Acaulospora colombiana]